MLLSKREGSGDRALNDFQSSSDLDVQDSQHQTTQPTPSAVIIYWNQHAGETGAWQTADGSHAERLINSDKQQPS